MEKVNHLYSLERFKNIFKIGKLEEVVPVTIAFDPNNYVPPGSPGIALKDSLFINEGKNPEGRTVFVSCPFPSKDGLRPGTIVKTYNKNLYTLPQKNLIINHKVKSINEFEKDKISDIGKYVATNAAITFIMPDLLNAANFWMNIHNMCSKYKYSSFFHHSGGTGFRMYNSDKFIPFVSFIDISYCIPIFDYSKVDGIGIYCGFMYEHSDKKGEEFRIIDTLCFVLSNHRTNFLYLDGAKIRIPIKINTSTIRYMLEFIKNEIKYKKINRKQLITKKAALVDAKLDLIGVEKTDYSSVFNTQPQMINIDTVNTTYNNSNGVFDFKTVSNYN